MKEHPKTAHIGNATGSNAPVGWDLPVMGCVRFVATGQILIARILSPTKHTRENATLNT
jgi:hypothetical protein